jgi:ribose transport system ATP-binding protein
MVDRDTSEMYPKRDYKMGEPILEVSNLTLNGHFNGVSFKLNKGEVLGITGLLGSGDKALLKCLFGLERPDGGEIALDGRLCKFSSPGSAVASGIAMIPEDRRAHGVATDLTISENISIASLKRHVKNGFVNTKTEAFEVNSLIDELKVKTPTPLLPVKSLSGGNQQKVVVAKWLSCDSSVYLLDDPTVAVDVGAKVEIYNLINRLADEGKGLIFVSSDLEETVEMCDRILVIYRGEIIEEFKRGDVDGARLLAIASGASAPTEEVVK